MGELVDPSFQTGKGTTRMMNLWRALLLLCVLLLTWFSLRAGLGGFYSRQAEQGDEAAIASALSWQPGHPGTLLAKALTLHESDPEAAISLLNQAYWANASDPRPLIALARLSAAREHWEQADALIDLASRLAPADWISQSQIAGYWASRGLYDKVLQHWSAVLTANPSLQTDLFPLMLRMAESSSLRTLFEPLTDKPPVWWNAFFGYVSRESKDVATVGTLFRIRQMDSYKPPTPEERAAYVARLQRDGMIAEAYILWVGGLKEGELRRLGTLLDGGFELPLRQGAFGWQLSENKNFSAKPASTKGVTGTAALHLRFSGFSGYFQNLSQPLLLDAGYYRLTGQVRADSLESQGGLRWRVRCLRPEVKVLGDGPRFLGTSEWDKFDLSFEVPAGCQYQQLVLVSAGERAFERKLDGSIWFDDLKIARVTNLDAAARADALLKGKEGAARAHTRGTKAVH
jgi:hypothetical protein